MIKTDASPISLDERFDPRHSALRGSLELIPTKKISAGILALSGILSFLIVQLNIYFAWTSHVGAAATRGFLPGGGTGPLRSFLVAEVNDFVNIQLRIPGLASFFQSLALRSAHDGIGPLPGPVTAPAPLPGPAAGSFHGGGFFAGGGVPFLASPNSLAGRYLIDTEVILFTSAVFVISLVLFRKRGIGLAILRALEITSVTILPLGLEIFLFDRFEFNTHASDIQVLTGTAWFTNADVLLLSSVILGAALVAELSRRPGRTEITPPSTV